MASGSRWTSQQARSAAAAIVRTLREHGHRALFAGGCVRDELLGLEPTDYDIATNATPDRVKSLFRNAGEVGKSFGVMLVREQGVVVEVATFRADGQYSDNRRPDAVTFGGEVEDAQRRDFTINALFLDPLDAAGDEVVGADPARIIDHVGGIADLQRRQIRAVGDAAARLREDHLRALRAVRFACRLRFTIEPTTRAAIAHDARALAGVSRERIGEELRRMLADPSRSRAAILLEELGLDAVVLNEPSLGERHHQACPGGGVLVWLGRAGHPVDPVLALAAWLLDRKSLDAGRVAIPEVVQRTRKALVLSNEERDMLRAMLNALFCLEQDWASMTMAARKRLIASTGFRGALALTGGRSPELWAQVRASVVELEASEGGIAPVRLLSGDDLIALGLRPGPRFASLLESVYDEQLEGRITTKVAAEDYVRSL
jgi:poly(A) polymerase